MPRSSSRLGLVRSRGVCGGINLYRRTGGKIINFPSGRDCHLIAKEMSHAVWPLVSVWTSLDWRASECVLSSADYGYRAIMATRAAYVSAPFSLLSTDLVSFLQTRPVHCRGENWQGKSFKLYLPANMDIYEGEKLRTTGLAVPRTSALC